MYNFNFTVEKARVWTLAEMCVGLPVTFTTQSMNQPPDLMSVDIVMS